MVLKIIEDVRLDSEEERDSPMYKTRTYYDVCMDVDRIEAEGDAAIKNTIRRYGGWSVYR